MNDLLANPLVQSAVLPIIIAAVLSYVVEHIRRGWNGLAALVAFYVSALLISGVQFWPLTSVRKIFLVGLAVAIVAMLGHRGQFAARVRQALWPGMALLATLWVMWPLLVQQQGLMMWLQVLGAAGYVVCLVLATESLSDHGLRASVTVMMLALATSLIAIVGASAMIGQLAAAIAAAIGALLALTVLRIITAPRLEFLMPLLMITALLGLAANAYASVPASSLLCLVALPMVMRIMPTSLVEIFQGRLWMQVIYYVLLALPVIAGAVYLAQPSAETILY